MSAIRFGSECSGIEAASVAFGPLGWEAAWFAEIAPFPAALLAYRYPHVANLGDMTKIARAVLEGAVEAPDVLCGGTPCQAFSFAGLRESLSDDRGVLTLKFVESANAIDHVRTRRGEGECVVFWENVPGVLNTEDNAFGCFLGALVGESEPLKPAGKRWTNAGCVYGPQRTVAWRVLDAQYFGLAQRRERVYVVASARPGFDPAEVLFEREGVRRDSPPSREAREIAPTIPSRSTAGGGLGTDFDCDGGLVQQAFGGNKTSGSRDVASALSALSAHGGTGRHDFETETFIAHTLTGEGFDASEDGTGRGTPLVPVTCLPFDTTQVTSAQNRSNPKFGDPCHPLAAGAHPPAIAFPANLSGTQVAASKELAPAMGATNPTAVAFQSSQSGVRVGDVHATLDANNGPRRHNGVIEGMQVRRLTPLECERLQGFEDGYTFVPTWNGWRKMDASETPEQCIADGLEVRQNRKTLRWSVKDVDGPRYKALGNSWPVPVVHWIGRRIDAQLRRSP